MASTNEKILPRTPDNPDAVALRGLEGTGSIVVPAGYEAQQRLFARGSVLDGINVAKRMKEAYRNTPGINRIDQQKVSDALTEQIDMGEQRLIDMDRTGPIGKLQAWFYASDANRMMMGQMFDIATKGEAETQALRYASNIVSYHEPDGMFDKYMTMAAGNLYSTGLPLLMGFVPGITGATGIASQRLGTALAASVMAIPTTTESYLDLKQRGLPTDEAMMTAGIHGIVETGIEFTLGNFLIGGANKALGAVGLKSMGATPGKVARAQQIFGILAKDKGDDAIGALVRGVDSGALNTASAKVALKEFFGDGSRAKILGKLFREGPVDAFTGGAEEWLQQGAELYIKELALANAGLDGVIPKREDGSYDIEAVFGQMNDAFVAGAVLEGMMGSLGGLAGIKSGWNTAKNMEITAHYLRGQTMEVTPGRKVVGPAGEGSDSKNVIINLGLMGPEAMDFITRHTLARRIVAERKAEEKYKDKVIPEDVRKSITDKALTESVQNLLDDQQQAAMLQFADAKFEMKGDNVMTLKVGNQTVTVLNSSGIPGEGISGAKYLHKEGNASTIGVNQEVWDKLVDGKLTNDVIGVHLYQGTTLPHEILHTVVTNMDEGPRQVFMDTIKVGENATPAETWKQQQEGLAAGQTPGQLGGIEAYTQGRYYAPVQTTLFDMWAGVDVAFNGRHASDTSKQRVLYRKTFGLLSGKKDLDFSKVTGEGFLRTRAIPAGKQIGKVVSNIAYKTGKAGKIAGLRVAVPVLDALDRRVNPQNYTTETGIPVKPVANDTSFSTQDDIGLSQTITSFSDLPTYKPGQKNMTYAGIGSRQTPPAIIKKMTEIANWLVSKGYTLQSGGAEGADRAFEAGAGNKKNIFYAKDATPVTLQIASEIHPKWSALKSDFVRKLMARNTFQVFSRNLNQPVDFVLTWTPDGMENSSERSIQSGGTGQAIDMASRKGIPVVNMNRSGWEGKLRSILGEPSKSTPTIATSIPVKPTPVPAKKQPRQLTYTKELAEYQRLGKELQVLVGNLLNSVPTEQRTSVRDRLKESIKAYFKNRTAFPATSKEGIAIRNHLVKMYQAARDIMKTAQAETDFQDAAAMERIKTAVEMAKNPDSAAPSKKEIDDFVARFAKNGKATTALGILANTLNSADMQTIRSFNSVMEEQLIGGVSFYDTVVEAVKEQNIQTFETSSVSENRSNEDIVQLVQSQTFQNIPYSLTGPPVVGQNTANRKDQPVVMSDITQASEARNAVEGWQDDSQLADLGTTRLKLVRIGDRSVLIKSWRFKGRMYSQRSEFLFPLHREVLSSMLQKLGVTLTNEQFNARYSFDENGYLKTITAGKNKLNFDSDAVFINTMNNLLGPLWLATREIGLFNPALREQAGQVLHIESAVRAALENKNYGKPTNADRLAELWSAILDTRQSSSIKGQVPGTRISSSIQFPEKSKRFLLFPRVLDQYFISRGLENDNTVNDWHSVLPSEDFRQNELTELDQELQSTTPDSEDSADMPTIEDQDTIETSTELSKILEYAEKRASNVVDSTLSAQSATRDVLRQMADWFSDWQGEGAISSPVYVAQTVMNRMVASDQGVPAKFHYADMMTAFGDAIEAAVRRRDGTNPYPSAITVSGKLDPLFLEDITKSGLAVKALDDVKQQLYRSSQRTTDTSVSGKLQKVLLGLRAYRSLLTSPETTGEPKSQSTENAIEAYLILDPKGETLTKLLDELSTKILGGIGLDQTISPLKDLPRGERLTTIKDLLNGIRDVRIFKLQLDTMDMSTKWLKIFGITPVGRMRDLLKGFFNSLMGKNLKGTETTGFEAGELARKYGLAAMFWTDIKNTMAMDDTKNMTSADIIAGYKQRIDGIIAKLTGDGTTRLKADESLQLSEYVKYKEAVEITENLVAGTDTYAAAVGDFIETTYKPMADNAWVAYRADTIKTHNAGRVPYYSPWLFLNDKEQFDPEDMDMNSYSQLTGRALARSNYNLNDHLQNGRVFRHPDIITAWESAISQLIHAVSNKEFIEKSLDAGYFATQPMAGYKALKAKGAAATRFILDGAVYKTFDEAFEDLKGKKDKEIEVKQYTVYAPEVEADYFNRITKTSGIRSSNIGRALMATNAKLKLVRVAWSMFHRRSLLWGAILAGPVDPGMEFTKGDLKDWSALWSKIKHRYDYTKMRELGNQLMEQRSPWIFGLTYHGMTAFRSQDFGDVNLEYLTKLDKAIIGTPMNAPHAALKSTVVGISRMTRAFQNELFGKFGATLKAAYAFREMTKAITKNLGKITAEKTESAKTGAISAHYLAFVEANGTDHAGTKQMEDNYDGVGKYASKTEDDVFRSVAGIANNNFGGIHLKRLGVSPGQFDMLRLLFLGPDWTASNFLTVAKLLSSKKAGGAGANSILSESTLERQMYNAYWMRALGRSAAIIFVINLLMSAIDDESAIERLTKAYKKGGLKATMIDISPVIHMLGGNKEVDHYLNFAGVFTEPLRWAKEPVKSVYYKSSTVLKPVMEAFMGTDYKGQRPSPIQDIPSKGLYSWENKNFGPISATEVPAHLLRQMVALLPIGAGQFYDLFTGEENVITFTIKQGTGIDTPRTYPAVRKSTPVGVPYQPSFQVK
jgi:hypothetical protein